MIGRLGAAGPFLTPSNGRVPRGAIGGGSTPRETLHHFSLMLIACASPKPVSRASGPASRILKAIVMPTQAQVLPALHNRAANTAFPSLWGDSTNTDRAGAAAPRQAFCLTAVQIVLGNRAG